MQVKRIGEYDIRIGVRNLSYGDVLQVERGRGLDEKELFIERCREVNLEWINP